MALTKFLFRPTEMEYINVSTEVKCEIQTATHIARKIMLNVMKFRRISGPKKSCATSTCMVLP